ncbi:MAG: hypothetical protein ACFFD9_00345 [Candidatus Thorarchaeota archaeon]
MIDAKHETRLNLASSKPMCFQEKIEEIEYKTEGFGMTIYYHMQENWP